MVAPSHSVLPRHAICIGMASIEATNLRSMARGLYGPQYIRPRSVSGPESMTRCWTRRSSRSIDADDSGSEEDRARVQPILSGHRALTYRDGRSTWIHAMHIEGARRRSHELTAVWQELRLGWPKSTHRWTWTSCREASLDCSGLSEETGAAHVQEKIGKWVYKGT